MRRLRALGWMLLLILGAVVGCGSPQDTKKDPPTKHDPTGTEGGRLPPRSKGS